MPKLLFPKAARPCRLPQGIAFQICVSSERPPDGADYLHQVKHDGWRVFVTINEHGRLSIDSRNGYDLTDEFGLPVHPLAALGRSMVIDGEMAVPDGDGLTHLDWFQDARKARRPDRFVFFAFDLLYYDGFDLRRCPIEQRIEVLDQLVADIACPSVLSVGYVIGRGAELFEAVRKVGAEGIVSKRLGKPSVAGESGHWLKTKVNETGRFVVIGYETELGKLKAIHVATERDGQLIPQGRVKFGLGGLHDRLEPLRAGYRDRKGLHPVKPELYVDVKYFGRISRRGKIPGGSLRDGVVLWFDGADARRRQRPRLPAVGVENGQLAEFRQLAKAVWWSCDTPAVIAAMDARSPAANVDDPAPQRRVSQPVESKIVVQAPPGSVSPENLQRVLDDTVVPSREELTAHWSAVGDLALEYLAHRPLTLVRHVDGLTFFHEGAVPFLPRGVHQMTYTKARNGETGHRVWIEDTAGLLGLLELGVVEVHPWSSRVDDFEHPDNLVLDLDPDPDLPWDCVVETALRLRDLFEAHDLDTWPKLTGGKGIHIVAEIEPTLTFDEARKFVRDIAERLAVTAPERYTTRSSLALRPGRIYLDYARNGLGATAVGCFSPRARPGFPVAMPAAWEDVERGVRPTAFTLAQVGAAASSAENCTRTPGAARERIANCEPTKHEYAPHGTSKTPPHV